MAFLLVMPVAVAAPIPSQAPAPPEPQPAQQTAPAQPEPPSPPATAQAPPAAPARAETPAPATGSDANAPNPPQSGEITEAELKQMLVGKPLFLRGGYLGDSLSFTERGDPIRHPQVGSYTLSGVQIEKVRLSRHKLELVGARYGLHFLGALPYEDPDKAVDRVKVTPKKKVLVITIDREQVVKPKKIKETPKDKAKKPAAVKPPNGSAPAPVASSETDVAAAPPPAPEAASPTQPPGAPAPAADAAKPETAQAEPDPAAKENPEDKAADEASVTTTTSQAHANRMLREALEKVFAPGLDDKVRAQMPQFWQLYYQAQAAGVDYRPHDPSVLRSSAVDQQAKLLTSIAPDSNEYAQANGIAGRALYRAVIGIDGKPGEIAVVRPIGFGLDEKAVEAIRKATFQPAVKDGKPVAETLDLAVLFRIYSKRTSVAATDAKPPEPTKPGPYTVRAQQEQQQ